MILSSHICIATAAQRTRSGSSNEMERNLLVEIFIITRLKGTNSAKEKREKFLLK